MLVKIKHQLAGVLCILRNNKHLIRQIVFAIVVLATSFALGYGLGVYRMLYKTHPPSWIRFIAGSPKSQPWRWIGYQDVRTPVPCPTGGAVIIALGQSNAGNRDTTLRVGVPGAFNFNFMDGKCYPAQDPLLGAVGGGGSPWTLLANELVSKGIYETVTIVPAAVGGSTVQDWTPQGRLALRIGTVLKSLEGAGLQPTHILWHQGEKDAIDGTSEAEYLERFASVARQLKGLQAPIYVAVASNCRNEGSEAVRAAQRAIPDRFEGARPGPDTDQIIGPDYRPDGCHLRGAGTERHVQAWLKALQ